MKRLISLALVGFCSLAQARVTLPSHFTSNMVVQQQSTLKTKGQARPGSTVSLVTTWNKKGVTAQTDSQGAFCMEIQTPKAGGPFEMRFSDGEETVLSNVLSGEVWLGSGQSNMEMPLEGWGKVLDYEKEIAAADYPQIRLLQVKKTTSLKPKAEVELSMDGWQVCSPATVNNFSALGYFYALRLWEELKVPVGIIDDDWGGTPCESWVSAEALTGVTGYEQQMQKVLELGQDVSKVRAYYKEINTEYARLEHEKDLGLCNEWYKLGTDDAAWPEMPVPCKWESLIGNFDGTVWLRRIVVLKDDNTVGKDVTVSFGTVDDMVCLYWNGEKIGETYNIMEQPTFTIPGRLVKYGVNEICLRVNDTGGDGGIVGKPEQIYLTGGKGGKVSLAGNWKYQKGVDMKALPARPLDVTDNHHPSVLYNAMIHPLREFPVKGIIWYQGCSNVGRAQQHEALFQTLISDWRKQFGNPTMPFYFVQLANYLTPRDVQPDSEWALLRETQAAALAMPNTGMAVNIDLGDANDIHPKTKRELGRRLSAIALNRTYGRKCPYTAPTYAGYTVEGSSIRIHLEAARGTEPLVQEQDLRGFTMAGADRKWYVATAHTEGNDIVVSCPQVSVPLAVRYGWADNPTCTLRTASGLHVAPFRTDKW